MTSGHFHLHSRKTSHSICESQGSSFTSSGLGPVHIPWYHPLPDLGQHPLLLSYGTSSSHPQDTIIPLSGSSSIKHRSQATMGGTGQSLRGVDPPSPASAQTLGCLHGSELGPLVATHFSCCWRRFTKWQPFRTTCTAHHPCCFVPLLSSLS